MTTFVQDESKISRSLFENSLKYQNKIELIKNKTDTVIMCKNKRPYYEDSK